MHLPLRADPPQLSAEQSGVSVADCFPIKPLIRSIQQDGRYQVLALTLADAKLYEGTRDTLERVDLGDAPLTIAEALGTELTEPSQKVARGRGAGGGAAPAPVRGAQGDRKDQRPVDRDRFFRAIDRQILERASKISRLPLVWQPCRSTRTGAAAVLRY